MPINIQIYSLLFSLFFGIIFSLLLHLNYRYIYKGPLPFRIAICFMLVIDCVLLYFITLKRINDGIVHKYFLLFILLGFVVSEIIFKKFKFTFQIKK
jgi:hypothetical protein